MIHPAWHFACLQLQSSFDHDWQVFLQEAAISKWTSHGRQPCVPLCHGPPQPGSFCYLWLERKLPNSGGPPTKLLCGWSPDETNRAQANHCRELQSKNKGPALSGFLQPVPVNTKPQNQKQTENNDNCYFCFPGYNILTAQTTDWFGMAVSYYQ